MSDSGFSNNSPCYKQGVDEDVAEMSSSDQLNDTSTLDQVKELSLLEQVNVSSTIKDCTSGENATSEESWISTNIYTADRSLASHAIGNSKLKPEVGMVFHSEDQAYRFYNLCAKREGFSVRKGHRSRRKDGTTRVRVFFCSNEGSRQQHRTYITKKQRAVARTNCLARIEYKVNRDNVWIVSKVIDEHNHLLTCSSKIHTLRSHRKRFLVRHGVVDALCNYGTKPFQVPSYEAKKDHHTETHAFLLRNQINNGHSNRARDLEKGDIQFLLDNLKAKQSEDPSFFYAIQLDEKERLTNFFWADARSVVDYAYFGDVVSFDTTYRTSIYDVPFAPFIGVNHHKQVVFGAALLLDETVELFLWLFKTFMAAIHGWQPKTIFTDRCAAISEAINIALPDTCHRLCLRQILQGAPTHLSHVYNSEPNFHKELRNCMYECSSEEDSSNSWNKLITKYNLSSNTWLQSLHADREKWALVCPQNSFWATIGTTEWSESMDSHFKKYFYRKLTPSKFITQYYKAVLQLREKELFEDCESRQAVPVLLVDVPMLNIAAESYTRMMYRDFEDEYRSQLACLCEPVGSDGVIYTFRVSLPQKQSHAFVEFNASDATVACSCKKFETIGILCTHALKVLNNNNILHLSSRYILKRWTKDAKGGVVPIHDLMIGSDGQELLLPRFGRAWRKALTVATKAAVLKDALELVEHRLDKFILEMEHILYTTSLSNQMEDDSDAENTLGNTLDVDEICFDAF